MFAISGNWLRILFIFYKFLNLQKFIVYIDKLLFDSSAEYGFLYYYAI